MRLCIDASNVKSGGGVTHLVELLRVADPLSFGFEKVVVWAPRATLGQLEDRPWLVKCAFPVFERNFLLRALWQRGRLAALARQEGCNLLFIPGGSFAASFDPVVVMSRNMLPFEFRELARFGISRKTVQLVLLRWTQSRSFRRANGIIFLTRYAHDAILKVIGPVSGEVAIIPHGIDKRFMTAPRRQRSLEECSDADPLRLIYVSIVDVFKHQWRVVEAVARLRAQGYPLFLELIGPSYRPALRRLQGALRRFDPHSHATRYLGALPHSELHANYARADIAVFASSCENMPNILLEAMGSGLPIACSNRGPMPEVLGETGAYFDPEDAGSIANTILDLILSQDLRARLARAVYDRAAQYSWNRCATDTFAFLEQVATGYTPARTAGR